MLLKVKVGAYLKVTTQMFAHFSRVFLLSLQGGWSRIGRTATRSPSSRQSSRHPARSVSTRYIDFLRMGLGFEGYVFSHVLFELCMSFMVSRYLEFLSF